MSDRLKFSVNWDYRCPFARNLHYYVITGLRAGAAWDVTFEPFSLGQMHHEEGEPDIWDHWQDDTGMLALQAGVVVRDTFPDRFLDTHEALFARRHDHGGQIHREETIRSVLDEQHVDADAVLAQIATGEPLVTVQQAHEATVKYHEGWGVPTLIRGSSAVFARVMNRPQGHPDEAIAYIERIVDLIDNFPELNEFKHTSLPR